MDANYIITFRPYTPQDEPFIQELYASSREPEMALVDWSPEQKQTFLTSQCKAQLLHYQTYYENATHDIILQDGVQIGRLYMHRTPDDIRLMDITLLTQYRNRGIGTHLIQALMAEGDATNRPVTLHVEIINPAAYRLYQRLGFTAVENKGLHIFMERLPKTADSKEQPIEQTIPTHNTQIPHKTES